MSDISIEIIKRIVEEVVKKFLSKKILVVFTGGKVNFDISLDELKKIKENSMVQYTLVFSRAASQIFNKKIISDQLDSVEVIEEGETINAREFVQKHDMVVFATLTRNTASKISHLILDTLPAQIAINGVLSGIPVIAVRDAADLSIETWGKLGFSDFPPALKNAYDKIFRDIESYGIGLCRSFELAKRVLSHLNRNSLLVSEKVNEGQKREEVSKFYSDDETKHVKLEKKLITREDIVGLKGNVDVIEIPNDSIMTPLAMDFIRENRLKVVKT
jgi:hypothetical protein